MFFIYCDMQKRANLKQLVSYISLHINNMLIYEKLVIFIELKTCPKQSHFYLC